MIELVAPSYTPADLAAVAEAVEAGSLGTGDLTQRFEAAVAASVGASAGQGTPSGTAALHLALVAAGVGPGHEVVTPSYTCIAILHAIHLVGARPVLVDNVSRPSTLDFNVDLDQLTAACGPKTRAIVIPHAFGVTADLTSVVADSDVVLIEDCAMALGSARDGVFAGSTGRLATFSFHATKVISTGAGGMVTAADDESAGWVRAANDYLDGQRRDRTAPITAVAGTYHYSCGYQLTDPQAALGLSQLGRLATLLDRRRQIAAWYTHELADIGVHLPTEIADGGYPFRFQIDLSPLALDPVDAIERLGALGVEAGRGVFPALHHYLGEDPAQFPNAERCTAWMLSLPVHPALDDNQVEVVAAACRRVLSTPGKR